MAIGVIHGRFDTQPRVVAGPDPAGVELLVPFRIEADPGLAVISWRLDASVDGVLLTDTPVRRITSELVVKLRERMAGPGQFAFDQVPPYLDMAARMGPGVTYLEGRVAGLENGAAVTYALEVVLRRGQDGPVVARSATCTTYAAHAVFGRADIVATHIPGPFHAMQAWVLHHRRTKG